jgi:uncharacterized protein YndB with AHSA1/START domain
MAPFVFSIDIDRRPEEVFAYATDPARFAEWQADVVTAGMDAEGPAQVGATFTTTRRIGPSERTMTQQITELNPPHVWKVRGIDGPLRPSMDFTVEPRDERANSRVTFALDFEGQGMADLLVPMVRRMAAKGAPASYRRLKILLESHATPARG